jgi:hypothetical protein
VVATRSGIFYGQMMTAGHIYTVAGDGAAGFAGDGSLATSAELHGPQGVAVGGAGDLIIADTGNDRIRVVATQSGTFYARPMTAGDIYTVAGTRGLFSGNGGPATAAQFIPNSMFLPVNGTVIDSAGNVVFDSSSAIRVLVAAAHTGTFYGLAMTAGHLYSIAGDGGYGFAGDGGPATKANFRYPSGLAVDHSGNVLLSDSQNNRIRVSPSRPAASTARL